MNTRDLSDPNQGPHAIQLIVDRLERTLDRAWDIPVRRDPGPQVVTVRDNYDRLGYSPDAITRDSRYSRYLGDGMMLRSHTTARMPNLLNTADGEVLWSVPGICYRRDSIDRRHSATPHQIDLWRERPSGPPLTEADLMEMIGLVIQAVVPDREWKTVAAQHPYTTDGREIYVADGTDWVEIGECGLAHPRLLRRGSALAMGLGLDRLLMLAKQIPDIRLLRSEDPRVARQMLDLQPYRPVSSLPPMRRDLSLALPSDVDLELIGDRVRDVLGAQAEAVEEVQVLQRTGYADLPPAALTRMGLKPGQDNVLLRLVLRHPTRTLTAAQANLIRDNTYRALHEGSAHEWASGPWSCQVGTSTPTRVRCAKRV